MARPYSYTLEAGLASNPDDPISVQTWTDLTSRLDVRAGIKITRGRPDEFGEVVPSQLSLLLDNSDGALTPNRPGSPYYPNVVSGKRIRLGLLWPGNGKNLYSSTTLNASSAAAGDTSFEGTGSFGWAGDLGSPVITQSAAQARTGTKSMLVSWGNTTLGRVYRYMRGLIPGRTYTVSVYVYVPTGSPNPAISINGGATFSTSTKNVWTRIERSFVCPAVGGVLNYFAITATSTGAGQLCYVDDVQIEEAPAATAFELTGGVFAWRFTGDVDEWPTAWEGGPALKVNANVTATDRLKKLGDLGEYQSFLKEDVLDDFPVAYYPLDEPAGSTTAGDISGNSQPPLTIGQVGSGGTTTFGWDHTDGATDYAVPIYYRDRTTGVKFVPSALGTPITAAYPQGQYLRATLKTPIVSTVGASVVCYAMFPSAGASDFGPVAFLTAPDGSYLGIHRSVFGGMTAIFVNKADGAGGVPWEVTVATNNGYDVVYQFAAILSVPSAGQGLVTFVQNGAVVGTSGPFTMTAAPQWSQVTVGGRDKQVDGVGRVLVSHVQAYDYAIATSPLTVQWYVAMQGRSSSVGSDTTTARLRKLLQFRGLYGGSPFVQMVEGGTLPTSIGPQEIDGNPLEAIRLVENTEDGVFFIGGDGLAEWQLRNYRFNAAVALSIAADRLSPDALVLRGDAYGVVNDVSASRPDGASLRYVNTASVNAAGRRKDQLTAIPQTDSDLLALASWRANTYGTQRNRLTGVKISLLNDPGLIPTALQLDIGSKLRVTALPSQAFASTVDLFIEGWDEVISEDEWSMSFNTSPAEVDDVWQIGVAGRSEIGTTTRIGY